MYVYVHLGYYALVCRTHMIHMNAHQKQHADSEVERLRIEMILFTDSSDTVVTNLTSIPYP